MASSNFMDNKTDKELEAEMGLSESQKMSLEAIGLTRDEIKKIHAQRVLDAMVKERARLAKLEAKVRKTLPMAFAEMLEGAEDTDAVIEETYNYDDYKDLLPPEGTKLPWEGRKDLLFTNADYWKECSKATKGDKNLEFPSNLGEMSDEEFNRFYEEWSRALDQKTNEIFERRSMGYLKAEYDWIKGGCKGKKPETLANIMAM